MYNSKISGLGMYVPENVVTNEDLSKIMDTSNEWIIERTGIKERRHIKKGDGNTTATMGVEAAKIFDFFAEEMMGYTDLQKFSNKPASRNANSSNTKHCFDNKPFT